MKSLLLKLPLKTLKRVFRLMRRTRERVPKAIVALLTLLVVLGAAVFFIAAMESLRWYMEREIQTSVIEKLRSSDLPSESVTRTIEALEEAQAEAREEGVVRRIFRVLSKPFRGEEADKTNWTDKSYQPAQTEPLTLSSFTDLFSSAAWFDEAKTTLHRDENITALSFPPRFAVESIGPPAAEFRARRADGSDEVCIWGDCLVARGDALFFVPFSERAAYADARYRLALPAAVADKKIISLSIGRLDTVWLVGVVFETEGEYEGRVFSFDGLTSLTAGGSTGFTAGGANYEEAFDPAAAPIRSRYTGALGFGGGDRDWIAVYGAYEGIAYRVRESTESARVVDISRFFGVRVMENGFEPVIIRADPRSSARSASTNWYVGSMTQGKPKLVKLFENGTGAVAGALDLTRAVFPLGTREAVLALEHGELLIRLEANGAPEWRVFRDLGFLKTDTREIVSKNLNTYGASEVRRAKIEELDASLVGGSAELFLSNDGVTWLPAETGREVVFPDPSGALLLWKARVTPAGDDDFSPFFDRIRIQFWVKFK